VLRHWRTIIRSGVIGVWVGILPGVGEDMAAWSSYATARRLSKNPEEYGNGSIEGLMAAETGDNASVPGGIIPALALGIPGSAPCAVLLAAMMIHGVQPGPMLMVQEPLFVCQVVAMVLFATLGDLVFRPVLYSTAPQDTSNSALYNDAYYFCPGEADQSPPSPKRCTVGSFSIAWRLFDVWTMLGFGTLAFVMRRYGYPVAPFVLGLVLGDILDKSLRRGLVLSDGDLLPFFTRPLSAVIAVLVIYTFLSNIPSLRRPVRGSSLGRRNERDFEAAQNDIHGQARLLSWWAWASTFASIFTTLA
jgi:putative tricarboxylic transport membrane protein